MVSLLVTGCNKTVVYPCCIERKDHMGWKITYNTTSSKKVWFPSTKIGLQIDSKMCELAVGVAPHLTVDMLLGEDVLRFQKLLKESLEDERIPVEAEEEKNLRWLNQKHLWSSPGLALKDKSKNKKCCSSHRKKVTHRSMVWKKRLRKFQNQDWASY